MAEQSQDADEESRLQKLKRQLSEIQANYDFLKERIPSKIIDNHIEQLKKTIDSLNKNVEQEEDTTE